MQNNQTEVYINGLLTKVTVEYVPCKTNGPKPENPAAFDYLIEYEVEDDFFAAPFNATPENIKNLFGSDNG